MEPWHEGGDGAFPSEVGLASHRPRSSRGGSCRCLLDGLTGRVLSVGSGEPWRTASLQALVVHETCQPDAMT